MVSRTGRWKLACRGGLQGEDGEDTEKPAGGAVGGKKWMLE